MSVFYSSGNRTLSRSILGTWKFIIYVFNIVVVFWFKQLVLRISTMLIDRVEN